MQQARLPIHDGALRCCIGGGGIYGSERAVMSAIGSSDTRVFGCFLAGSLRSIGFVNPLCAGMTFPLIGCGDQAPNLRQERGICLSRSCNWNSHPCAYNAALSWPLRAREASDAAGAGDPQNHVVTGSTRAAAWTRLNNSFVVITSFAQSLD